jgi:uncharacterized membrane protein
MKAAIVSLFLVFYGGYTLILGYYGLIGLTTSEPELSGAGYLHLFISAVITYLLVIFGPRMSGIAIVADTEPTAE